jgi:hypothetical protein
MRNLVALLFATTVSTTAVSNDSGNTFVAPFDAICTTQKIFGETMLNYGETPIMRGQSMRNINGAMVAMNTVLFMNLGTGSWTLAERMSDDAFCVVAMGENWQVYQYKNPGVQG